MRQFACPKLMDSRLIWVVESARYIKAAFSVTFDLLILEIMFLFFKNTAKNLKFRYIFDQFRKS